ncbi:hypothetical protein AVEN_71382-1 [Araneus ventricosus]|uniref:Uncharacterized protein n=1 Tax=Araneus ventricosus TaxID=182803 RepID=A0A4Y2BIH3_ARAVE|nr:hypothetical protein AVEN_71382-1 [Araneus ventricosus]
MQLCWFPSHRQVSEPSREMLTMRRVLSVRKNNKNKTSKKVNLFPQDNASQLKENMSYKMAGGSAWSRYLMVVSADLRLQFEETIFFFAPSVIKA